MHTAHGTGFDIEGDVRLVHHGGQAVFGKFFLAPGTGEKAAMIR
jgi:hypothetical protein